MDYIIKLATQEGHQNKCEVSSILNKCIKGLLSHDTIWWPEEGSKISFFKVGFFFKGNGDEHKNRFGVSFYPKINAVAENISNWTFLQFTIE
jgi:hypothetical protein